MWTPAVFALCLTSAVLCLDSNEIRSSREIITDPEPLFTRNTTAMPSEKVTVNVSVHNNVRRRQQNPECTNQQGNRCKGTKKRQGRKNKPDDTATEKGAKRGECVRSRDCEEGWCCVQFPSGGRCQRVPQEGEMCTLGGPPKSKSRRIFKRCACTAGLNCLRKPGSPKGQGECGVHGREQDNPH
ncbi:dickkopf-related protein 4 [Ictalurus punctatus]|uniref:Dickkopf-related protein 4 n=1 Tax=Ictalurus punctatus TaxID=7998 RepID=A0A2D0R0H9_ICTPU|nr:dickkopf-related protein 4 [Ictalurus punctatus]